MIELSSLLSCKIDVLSHTHLDLPLCITKPRVGDCVPMLKIIENILLGCSTLLSCGDKLILIKISILKHVHIFHVHTDDAQDCGQENQHLPQELLLKKIWVTRKGCCSHIMG